MTVTGEIEPSELGLTLPHEHLFTTFGQVPKRYPDYPEQKLMDVIIPYLKGLKEQGIDTIVDATTAYVGRHPEYLKQISQATGIQILTNTGYFGAEAGVYLPEHIKNKTAEEIASRWLDEINNSIDETGIYPGFIKTAIEHKPLLEFDKKIIEAAARTHKNSGYVIQTHVGNNVPGANEVLDILTENDVDAEAWIWVHAHEVPYLEYLIPAAKMGAYLSFDGLNEKYAEDYITAIKYFKKEKLLNHFLLSHSGNIYREDGTLDEYRYLLDGFKTLFLNSGLTESDFQQITVTNPKEAFTPKIRLL